MSIKQLYDDCSKILNDTFWTLFFALIAILNLVALCGSGTKFNYRMLFKVSDNLVFFLDFIEIASFSSHDPYWCFVAYASKLDGVFFLSCCSIGSCRAPLDYGGLKNVVSWQSQTTREQRLRRRGKAINTHHQFHF